MRLSMCFPNFFHTDTRKFHELSHLVENLRRRGAASAVSTEHGERGFVYVRGCFFNTDKNGPQGLNILRRVITHDFLTTFSSRLLGEAQAPLPRPPVDQPGLLLWVSSARSLRRLPPIYYHPAAAPVLGALPLGAWRRKGALEATFAEWRHNFGERHGLDPDDALVRFWPTRAVLRNTARILRPSMCDTQLVAGVVDGEAKHDFVELNEIVDDEDGIVPPYYAMMEVEFIISYHTAGQWRAPHPTFAQSILAATKAGAGETVDFVFGRLLDGPVDCPAHTVVQQRAWRRRHDGAFIYHMAELTEVRRKLMALQVFPPGEVDRERNVWEYDRFNIWDYSEEVPVAPAAPGV
jgi:hypothetical protein